MGPKSVRMLFLPGRTGDWESEENQKHDQSQEMHPCVFSVDVCRIRRIILLQKESKSACVGLTEAQAKIPKNPTFWISFCTPAFAREEKS